MAEKTILVPNINFIKDVKRLGGNMLSKCYQCATCSSVCPLSSDNKPFPRKEMIMAQMGMESKLSNDPDIWYCHNCNDCSKYCPRGARPGDVIGALRRISIKKYSVPQFMGHITDSIWLTILSLVIPALFFVALLNFIGYFHIPTGKIVYAHLFPLELIDAVFVSFVILSIIGYIMGLRKFWVDMIKWDSHTGSRLKNFPAAFIEAVLEFLSHRKFGLCDTNKDRKSAHLYLFYGFVALFITTVISGIYADFFHYYGPYRFSDPIKWIANFGALLFLVGIALLVVDRLKNKGVNSKTSDFDWTFLILIFLLGLTGLLSEAIRFAGIRTVAYSIYFVHLVLVFYTIVYFPYSKLAHIGYRLLAITHYKMIGKDIT